MTHNLNQPTLHFPQKKSHPSFRDPDTPGVGSSLRHTSGDERSSTNGASTPETKETFWKLPELVTKKLQYWPFPQSCKLQSLKERSCERSSKRYAWMDSKWFSNEKNSHQMWDFFCDSVLGFLFWNQIDYWELICIIHFNQPIGTITCPLKPIPKQKSSPHKKVSEILETMTSLASR